MDGAILISRALIDSEVFASEKLLKIWIWLLIKANYKERMIPVKIGHGQSTVKLSRGELLFGRLSAENDLFIDGSTIYKCIKRLEKLGNIKIKSNSHYSIISICNYDKYQDISSYKVAAKEQPSNSQVTTEEQPSNTDNKDNKDIYTDWVGHEDLLKAIQNKYPKLLKMKFPLTFEAHDYLIKTWGAEKVKNIYAEMQNYSPLLKKNENAALTAQNWLRRNDERLKK